MRISAAGGVGIAAGAIGGIATGVGLWKLGTGGDHKPVMKPLLVGIGAGGAAFAAAKGASYLAGRGVSNAGHFVGGSLGSLAVIGAGVGVGLVGASVVNGVRRALD